MARSIKKGPFVDQYLIDIETYPSMELQIWYKRRAISKRDLVEINEDAEQREIGDA